MMIFASALALVSSAAVAKSGSADPLVEAFAHPDKAARPQVRWWWPGDAVDIPEIQREIALLDDAGFGGAEIQAFNPGIPGLSAEERAAVDRYAQPSFFEHVAAAAKTARQHGLTLDYTFGSAWPSGGGTAITPERALLELTMSVQEVDGGKGKPIMIALPPRTKRMGALNLMDSFFRTPEGSDWKERFDARSRTVAVMAMRGSAPVLKPKPTGGLQMSAWSDVETPGRLDSGSQVDLTSKLAADGTLDWTPPPGHWIILTFRQHASNMPVTGAAGRGPQLVLNHYDPKAFPAHAARVGDPLMHILPAASGLRATFVDSLELFQDLPWSEDFLTQFEKRRGYDLRPWLPYIVQPGWMQAWAGHYGSPYFVSDDDLGVSGRVRADYQQTVSDLLVGGFLKPWTDWNRAHHLLSKFQAHGAPMDVLLGYGMADLPETEDLHDGGSWHFMRLARAAGNIYGRNVISAESMAWKDRPFSVTPQDMRRRADLLFASGVNAQTLHGFPYSLHTDKWPGWFPFAPSPFGGGFSTMIAPANPVWPAMPVLAQYMSRMNAVMRTGSSVVPVAIYLGEIGYYEGIDGQGEAEAHREARLMAAGYDFDRINADGLARSRVVGGALVTPGGHRYEVLVLPAVTSLRAETAEAVARFAAAGLPVIYTRSAPKRETGFLDYRRRDARVEKAMQSSLSHGARIVAEGDLMSALASAHVSPNLRYLNGTTEDVVFTQRKVGNRLVYFLHNVGALTRDASFVAPIAAGAERWDAMDGQRSALGTRQVKAGTAVALSLEAGESALIVLDRSQRRGSANASRDLAAIPLPMDGWQISFQGHVSGGTPYVRDLPDGRLGDWRDQGDLRFFSGEATYTRSFDVPAEWQSRRQRVILTLQGVHDIALVAVNGRKFGPLLDQPWSVDITDALQPGTNALGITIANVPQNGVIGTRRPGYDALTPVPAGLGGPVTLRLVGEGAA